MQITDILGQMGGLQSIARDLGVSEGEVATGAEALVPAILGGFKRQAQAQPAGLEGLGGLLGQLGGGSLLENVLSPQPTDARQGDQVLGEIFGSKDVSRTVAQNAATRTGLDPSLLRKMLPLLAMLVAGFMSRQQGTGAPTQSPVDGALGGALGGASGGLGGLLGGLLGGRASPTPGGAPQGGMQGGLGGLASMLDMNGDGNVLDDILRMAGKGMR